MYNIIGDIAGHYNELMKLIKIIPQNNKIILVGDLVDRGPDSAKVVSWAMSTPNVITLKGNHEAMMIEAADNCYDSVLDHLYNGGKATMKSYGVSNPDEYPKSHIEWMRHLPLFFRDKGLFVSHAAWYPSWDLDEVVSEHWALWNRGLPSYRSEVYQVHGHMHLAEIYKNDGIEFGRCIDNCGRNVLTGFTWPEKKIYEVGYETI